ncbi:hypothetical protein HYH03_006491 [Edaphochlamys debaryana]|uniref:Uncharacterized protein n=1 Tax=Edaphochlamys debaryana TaxID=47281 RepID=A0A835Y6C2_9CHLO|nr:hypothetical protein HYH03_006491 [Edaphochlamys debaryana]|eukprot:KAG2495548.1 hypothetical protein HYH03_006491 [Edaphochlamys debaryana]
MSEKGWNSSISALSDDTPTTPSRSYLVDTTSDDNLGVAARTSDPGSSCRRALATAEGFTSLGWELSNFFSQHMPSEGPAIPMETPRNVSRVYRNASNKLLPVPRTDAGAALQPTPRSSLNGGVSGRSSLSGVSGQTVASTPKRAAPPPLQLCSPSSAVTASSRGPVSPMPPSQAQPSVGRLPRVPTSNSLGGYSDPLPTHLPPAAASPRHPMHAFRSRNNLVGLGANQFLSEGHGPHFAPPTKPVAGGPLGSAAGPTAGPSSETCLPPLPTRWSGDGTSGWARRRAPCSSLFSDGGAEFDPMSRAARAHTLTSKGATSQRWRRTTDGRDLLLPSLPQAEGSQVSCSPAVLPLPDIISGVPSPRLACAWAASDPATCSPAQDPDPGLTRQLLAAVHGTDPATPMRPSAPLSKSRRWNPDCGPVQQLVSPFRHMGASTEAAGQRLEPAQGLGTRALRASVTVPAPQLQAMAWQPKPPSPPAPPPPVAAPLPCRASAMGCRRPDLPLETGSDPGDASLSRLESPLALAVVSPLSSGGGGVRRQQGGLNPPPSAAGVRAGVLAAVTEAEAEEEWLLPMRGGRNINIRI